MKRNTITLAVIALLLGLALFSNFGKKDKGSLAERPEEGFAAPAFELQGLDSQTYSLQGLKKPIVLNFWASWCGPCRLESPMLTALYSKYKDQLEIYAINMTGSDQLDKVQSFAEHFKFQFPVLLDTENKISDLYQVQYIPTSFFVDRNGTVYKVATGLHTKEQLEELIKQLIEIK